MADEAAQNVEAPAQESAQSASKPSGSNAGDTGFSEGKPLEQMSVEQREAYWKRYSRQHEDEAKSLRAALNGLDPGELPAILDKASKYDALEYELKSEQDKALESARKEAAEQARSELLPQLVKASFDAHAAQAGIDSEKLADLLDYTEPSKFIKDGKVDEAAIEKFVGKLKPAEPERQKFPSGIGLGNRGVGGFLPGERGKAEAQRRFGSN